MPPSGNQGEAPVATAADGPAVILRYSATARQYRLTLRRDGTAVATIPARGSEREALRFVERQRPWLERARARQLGRPRMEEVWSVGTLLLWRGEMTEIRVAGPAAVCLAADVFRVARPEGDLRPALEAQFARRARIELPARTWELSAVTGSDVRRVTVRNQRSRWGSCSAAGTISLNWRLLQTPGPGPRLHHPPRDGAPPGNEPLGPLLVAGRGNLSRLAGGGALDQEEFQPRRALKARRLSGNPRAGPRRSGWPSAEWTGGARPRRRRASRVRSASASRPSSWKGMPRPTP